MLRARQFHPFSNHHLKHRKVLGTSESLLSPTFNLNEENHVGLPKCMHKSLSMPLLNTCLQPTVVNFQRNRLLGTS